MVIMARDQHMSQVEKLKGSHNLRLYHYKYLEKCENIFQCHDQLQY